MFFYSQVDSQPNNVRPEMDSYSGAGEADMADMEGSGDAMALAFDEDEAAGLKPEDSPEQSLGKCSIFLHSTVIETL